MSAQLELAITTSTDPDANALAAAVAILHDSFAPDEGGGVTVDNFMAPRPGRALITASTAGQVVGFARIDRYRLDGHAGGGGVGLLAWLAVAEGARSSGVGRQLIDVSAARLADGGAESMFVECRVDDYYAPRRRFYERNDIVSISGGDYWLESHGGPLIQYDLLHRPLGGEPTSKDVDRIVAGATAVHSGGAGRRPHRLAAGLAWTLRSEPQSSKP